MARVRSSRSVEDGEPLVHFRCFPFRSGFTGPLFRLIQAREFSLDGFRLGKFGVFVQAGHREKVVRRAIEFSATRSRIDCARASPVRPRLPANPARLDRGPVPPDAWRLRPAEQIFGRLQGVRLFFSSVFRFSMIDKSTDVFRRSGPERRLGGSAP